MKMILKMLRQYDLWNFQIIIILDSGSSEYVCICLKLEFAYFIKLGTFFFTNIFEEQSNFLNFNQMPYN